MKLKRLFTPMKILDDIKMRQKLLLIYFILIVLPISFFTFLIYSRISDVMQQQTLNSGTQVYEESVNILNSDFEIAANAITVITTSRLVYDVILRTYNEHDLIEEVNDKSDLSNLFLYLRSNTSIEYIHLYTFGGELLIDDNSVITNLKSIEGSEWYNKLIEFDSNTIWIYPSINTDFQSGKIDSFSAARIIYDPEALKQSIGIIKIDIPSKRIENIISNTLITQNCISYISSSDSVIKSTAPFDAGLQLSADQLISLESKGWNRIKLGSNEDYVNVKRLNLNDWYLVTILPAKDLAATAKKLLHEMLIIMIFISMAAFILAYYISASTIKRLSLLSKEMKKVETDLSTVSLVKMGNDEIGELMEDFNYMISKINILVDEKYKMGIDIKSSELKALQAQINPHFLYNTLEMINCTALLNNIPEIAAQVKALSKFYKLSLNRGSEIITIGEELEHVKTYVQIQNMRFQNRISFNITSEEDIKEYKTLKIILQPIVENSILHGIFEKNSKCGTINVFVSKDGESIFFNIEDDGVGIPEEKLKELLNYEVPSQTSGYGIRNIDQRIRLYYGQEYGLTYRSIPGEGTKVSVHIPALYV